MIVNAHTIVNPRAVMIVPLYTTVADSTVLGPARADHFTIRTHFTRMNFLQ